MKSRTTFLAVAFGLGALCAPVPAGAAPQIQFDRTIIDFGKTSQVASVSGVFKFKNVGDAILKVDPPKPSCGCTVAELKSDTLAPGASGELPFTLNLGQARAVLEKHISIHSNDPKTPDVSLTIKVDFTPLYDLNPMTFAPVLAFGVKELVQSSVLTRTDGKPLRLARLEPSKPWIKATVEAGPKTEESVARIQVVILRDGPPRRFNEFVQVYAADQTNAPVASLWVYGQFLGEVSLSPETLYWSVSGPVKPTEDRPEASAVRRVTVRTATDKELELKNPQSTIKGLKVELVRKDSGKLYELVARLEETPASTVSGHLSFETSVAEQARVEVPIVINVFKP